MKRAPLVASWFDPDCRVFSERSIYRSDDDEAFRPDRVVISPDGAVTVVDYKFTSEPRPTHFAQVEKLYIAHAKPRALLCRRLSMVSSAWQGYQSGRMNR